MCHDISFSHSPMSTSHAKIGKVYTFFTIIHEQLQPHIPDDLLQEPKIRLVEDKTYQKAWKTLETLNPKQAY